MEIEVVIEENLPLAETSRIVRRIAESMGWQAHWNGDGKIFRLRREESLAEEPTANTFFARGRYEEQL